MRVFSERLRIFKRQPETWPLIPLLASVLMIPLITCGSHAFMQVESIEFLQAVTVSMLAFPFSEWLFAANFSSALTFHEAQPSHLDQLTISFARGVDCTNSEDDDSMVQITLGDMSGLFIACFVLLGTSVPVALFQRHRRGLDDVTKPKGLNVEA